ncbi:helix-turn-helix domain-containing protein [Streptomyces sp. NPDC002738]
MGLEYGTSCRRRRLGEALHRHRNDAGLSLDAAAKSMGRIAPKLSRIENAVGYFRSAEVPPCSRRLASQTQISSSHWRSWPRTRASRGGGRRTTTS